MKNLVHIKKAKLRKPKEGSADAKFLPGTKASHLADAPDVPAAGVSESEPTSALPGQGAASSDSGDEGDLRSQLSEAFIAEGERNMEGAHNSPHFYALGRAFQNIGLAIAPAEPKLMPATAGVGEGAPSGKLPEPPTVPDITSEPLFGEQQQ